MINVTLVGLGLLAVCALSSIAAPSSTRQPSSLNLSVGTSASFIVAANGTGTITYQWRFRGVDLPTKTNATLRIAQAAIENLGEYSVLATDMTGTVESQKATLSLNVSVRPAFVPGLEATISERNLALSWRGEGIVQTAPSASGSWTPAGATRKNSYSARINNGPATFYRLRNPHPREVSVFLPSAYRPDSKSPLLIFLHGYNGNAAVYEGYLGLRAVAEEVGLVFCSPEGVVDAAGSRFWNASQVCCDFKGLEVNDVMFLHQLVTAITERYAIDPTRIYFAGHSNGAFMSLRMAMEYSQEVAAVAAISGTMDEVSSATPPSTPVNILQIHGTVDELVDYRGGKVGGGLPITGSCCGVLELLARWGNWNGCGELTMVSDGPTLDLDQGLSGLDTIVWRSKCPEGVTVEHWAIAQGVHAPNFSSGFTRAMVQWLMDHPSSRSPGVR
jgi:polyhydroxybutyrate depolymerase